MVLKKIKNMKRHFAELCEGDGNGSKTAPTPVNFAETCTEKMRAPGTVLESNPKKRGKPWGGKRSWSNPGKIGHRSLISIFSLKIAEHFADFLNKILQICQDLLNFAKFSILTNIFQDFSQNAAFSQSLIFLFKNI